VVTSVPRGVGSNRHSTSFVKQPALLQVVPPLGLCQWGCSVGFQGQVTDNFVFPTVFNVAILLESQWPQDNLAQNYYAKFNEPFSQLEPEHWHLWQVLSINFAKEVAFL
jgi:hypothetical protein